MEEERFGFHETAEAINKGDDFQFVLGKFVLHRLINQKFKNFRLTREKKGCGKFDDLVFSYETNEGKNKYHLMQLKCMANEDYKIGYKDLITNPNSYFLLQFYFDHYLESLNYLSKDIDFKDSDLEELIICTNVGIEDSLECITKQEISNTGLFRNSGNIYKLSINDPEKRKEIFSDQFLSERERLANELVLSLMLKKTINIQSMIHDQTFSLIKRYYKMLITYVINVKSKKFKPSFLNGDFKENDQELQDFRKNIFDALIKFYEKYKDKSHEDLKKLLYFGKFKNVTYQKSKVNALRSLLKNFNSEEIVEFLEKRDIEIIGIPNEDTEISFPSGSIDEKFVDQNISKFLELLTFVVNQTRNENLISNEIDNPFILNGFNTFMKNWYSQGVSLHSNMAKAKKNYRRWITEKTLLEELEQFSINFQGKMVKFGNICPPSEVSTPETLMNAFLENKVLNLGKSLQNEHSTIYINRTLTQKGKVCSDVFMKSTDCFIIVSLEKLSDMADMKERYPSKKELKDLMNFEESHPFYFTYTEFSLKMLHCVYFINRKAINGKMVHWLSFTVTDLKFESTYRWSPSFFEQFCQGSILFNESELINKKKIIIITGDPGIGKTALLKNVSSLVRYTNEFQINWVIKISLNECQDFLSELDYPNDLESVINFLTRCEHCYDSYSRTILRRFLVKDSRLVLIFDGFDEVFNPKYRKNILQLLRFLKTETVVKQIWISTRYHYVRQLEKCLDVTAFAIKDFSEDDQIHLVTKIWNETSLFPIFDFVPNDWIQRNKSNAEILVRNFNISLKNQERKFLGIALHTYMLAITFEEKAKSEIPFRLEQMNLAKLYKYFFRKKFKTFFDERIKDEALREEFIDYYYCQFQRLAFEFGGVINFEDISTLTNLFQSELNYYNLHRIGFTHMNENGYQFIHKTLAEYLIASYLCSNFKFHRFKKDALRIMNNVLLDERNDFMLYLFDTMFVETLDNCKVQRSIMLGDVEFVKKLNKDSLNKLDDLERSNFYYALKYSQFHIIQILIEKGIDLKCENYFLSSLTSFVENSKSSHFMYTDLFQYILEKEDKGGSFALYYLHLFLDIEEETSLHHWNIVEKLIEKFEIKIPANSSCLNEIPYAPDDFFIVFIKSVERLDYYLVTDTVIVSVLDKLLNCESSVLKCIFSCYRSFFISISVGGLTPNQKDFIFLATLRRIQDLKFSEFINYLRMRAENFKILCNCLLEYGLPSEQFDSELRTKGTDHFRIISFAIDSHLNFESMFHFFENIANLDINRPISYLLSAYSSDEEKSYKDDFLRVLYENKKVYNYDDSTEIKKAVKLIINHIKICNEIVKITNSIKEFNECILEMN